MRLRTGIWVALLAALVLGGCGIPTRVAQVQSDNEAALAKQRTTLATVRTEVPAPVDPVVKYHDGPVVTLKALRTRRSAAEQGGHWCNIRKLATAEPVDIMEFAQIVTRWCGVVVRVTPDAIEAIDAMARAAQGTAMAQARPPGTPGAASDAAPARNGRLVDISYSGDLEGLLDVVAAKFGGLSWKREDGRVTIYNLDTQTFHLYAFGSSTDITADSTAGTTMAGGIAGGGGGSGTGSSMSGSTGATQSTKISIKTSIWEDVKGTLETIRSPKGKCSISPASGTITCTDTGEGLRRVAAFVRAENANLTKQVLFHVKIYSVTFKATDSLGLAWTAFYENLKGKYGIRLANTLSAPAGATLGTFMVLDNSGSRWQGSDAVFSALSEVATVGILKEPSVPTLNLQAVPIQVANVDAFVPGSTMSSAVGVGSTTSLQVATVTTGFAMTLLPYVLPQADDAMLLHFSLTLSTLDDIRKIEVGTAYAEAPIVNLGINATQRVRLRSGQTLMLTGFDQNSANSQRRGTSSPTNWLFGGGMSSGDNRSTLVVLVTPIIDAGELKR